MSLHSPRGLCRLARTEHDPRGYRLMAIANPLQAVGTRWIGAAEVKRLAPIINIE